MPELRHGSTRAYITTSGGWVEELQQDAYALLYPKTTLRSEQGDEKVRGGMHVCLPNFGPGGNSGLPQHGFGRMSEWRLNHATHATTEVSLAGGTTQYTHLNATLTYTVGNTSFDTVLTLSNQGAQTLRVAPAFHPYFALDESETAIKLNGRIYELSELLNTEFLEADTVELVTAHRTLHLSQTGLSTWAIWTDRLGPYVCVEPTFGGYRFLSPKQPDELLLPDQAARYSFHIDW